MTRFPAVLPDPAVGLPAGTHLVVDTHEPLRRHLELAEIVVVPNAADAGAVLASLPGCALATGPLPDGGWLVLTPDGERVRVEGLGRVGASVVHHWLAAGKPLHSLPSELTVRLGARVVPARLGR